jgi:hypothetical protein
MKQLHKRKDWKTVWNIVAEFSTRNMAATVACQWLRISRSRLYQLRRRWFEMREKPVSDWLYQRPGTGGSLIHPKAQTFLKDECRYIKQQSPLFKGHFNFSFLSEQCHRLLGKRYSRHTLRRWAIREGLFNPQVDTTAKAFVRFETGGIGMLFQHDSSKHLWVPATQRQDILIATIDDHSRKLVAARLVPRDSTWHNMCVVRETMERYGRPQAYYVDNYGVFRPDKEPATQFGRALGSLDVELKFTGVRQPQAKGKIEKIFDYLQKRLPYLCERYKIKNLTQANKILDNEVVGYYNEYHVHETTQEIPNKRWRRAIEEGRCFLRPIPDKTPLDIIFALHYPRQLKKDGSFVFHSQRYEIPKAPRYAEITLVLRPPWKRHTRTTLTVLWKGSTLAQFILR